MKTYRVIRWVRLAEDATVQASDIDDAYAKAEDAGAWTIVDHNVVDFEAEEL